MQRRQVIRQKWDAQDWRQRHDGSTPARGLPDRPARQLDVDERDVAASIHRLRARLAEGTR